MEERMPEVTPADRPSNRISPTSVATAAEAARAATVVAAASPTGTPLLPPKFIPYAYGLWALLTGGGLAMLPEGRPMQVGSLVSVALGVLLGLVSPGLRKH